MKFILNLTQALIIATVFVQFIIAQDTLIPRVAPELDNQEVPSECGAGVPKPGDPECIVPNALKSLVGRR